jgi:hypothetical protein
MYDDWDGSGFEWVAIALLVAAVTWAVAYLNAA